MSLYANESIEMYDPITGRNYSNLEAAKRDDELNAILTAGEQMRALRNVDGWKLLESFITANITHYHEMLVSETDGSKIARLQSTIKVYRNIIAFIDGAIMEADTLKQQQLDPSKEG